MSGFAFVSRRPIPSANAAMTGAACRAIAGAGSTMRETPQRLGAGEDDPLRRYRDAEDAPAASDRLSGVSVEIVRHDPEPVTVLRDEGGDSRQHARPHTIRHPSRSHRIAFAVADAGCVGKIVVRSLHASSLSIRRRWAAALTFLFTDES